VNRSRQIVQTPDNGLLRIMRPNKEETDSTKDGLKDYGESISHWTGKAGGKRATSPVPKSEGKNLVGTPLAVRVHGLNTKRETREDKYGR